jgi:hypothetical protein
MKSAARERVTYFGPESGGLTLAEVRDVGDAALLIVEIRQPTRREEEAAE